MSATTIFIVLAVVGVVVAAVAVAVYFATKNKGPAAQFTEELNFYNGLTINGRQVPIYLTARRGNVDDTNGWTNWEPTPNTMTGSTEKMIPLPDGLKKAFKLNYGEYGHVAIGSRGYPGINYVVRANCDDQGVEGNTGPTFICEKGDSYEDPYIDLLPPNASGHQSLKRGNVPFKPDIDTKMEFSFGCTEVDKSYCAVNPSCILAPSTCFYKEGGPTGPQRDMNYFMAQVRASDPGAIFKEDLLLHASNGDIIPLPAGLHLGSNTNFDVSNVDGFTHQADYYTIRPTVGDSAVGCFINATRVDSVSVGSPQILIDTSTISLQQESACPSSEVLWPANNVIVAGDGYQPVFNNQSSPAGTITKGMGYDNAPVGTFTGGFGPGSANSSTDLKMYRNTIYPTENRVAVALSQNPYLGCASPCKILTDGAGRADTQMNPVPGTTRWSKGTYLANPSANPSSQIQGIRQICCTPDGLSDPSNPTTNTFMRCNTSRLWALDTSGAVDNYGASYYVKNYEPRPADDPWFITGNPYLDLALGSAYVNAVNNGKLSSQGPRTYAWQHDDAYKLVQCNIESPNNEGLSKDGKRTVYRQYKVLVTIGSRPAGL